MSFVSRLIGARRRTVAIEEDALEKLRRGDIVAARQLADKALALAPRAAEVHHLSARVAIAERRFDAASAHLQTAVASEPCSSAMYFDLARALILGGRSFEALDAYQNVLRIEPSNPEALIGLAEASAEIGDLTGARESLLRAKAGATLGGDTTSRTLRIEALEARLASPVVDEGTP